MKINISLAELVAHLPDLSPLIPPEAKIASVKIWDNSGEDTNEPLAYTGITVECSAPKKGV